FRVGAGSPLSAGCLRSLREDFCSCERRNGSEKTGTGYKLYILEFLKLMERGLENYFEWNEEG
ncbi:hypothetical protein, partial [Leptospira ellisii]|uniref:hypothetical protein n=1 Tax=Leptospira ellisii TaxID=2023197 RepID=UPI001A9DF4A8